MTVFLFVLGVLMSLAGLMAVSGFMLLGEATHVPALVFSIFLLLAGIGLIVLGARKRKKKKNAGITSAKGEPGIVGRWQDARGSVSEFKGDGTWIVDGSTYLYRTDGGKLEITSKDGVIKAAYRLAGDTLYTTINGNTNVWNRLPDNKKSGYFEKDNRGIRQSTLDQAMGYWSARNMRQKFDPFLLYTFESEEQARKGLLESGCIFQAQDSGGLICTEPYNFGCYPTESGRFEAIVAGESLPHALWEKARESFVRHGGKCRNEQEPERMPVAVPVKQKSPASVRFIQKTTSNGNTYEAYTCDDTESAKEFLLSKSVDKPKYYVVVQTPAGVWGTDCKGLYKEHLLPWQGDVSSAKTEGETVGIPDMFSLQMAANGINDNFVAGVECGKCGHHWVEGLRYQAWTVVQCPNCGVKNKVNSHGYNVVHL